LEDANNGGDKDLVISDDWITDNFAFQTCSSHGVWQPSFSYDFSFPLDAQDMVCSDQHFIQIVDRQSIASLQDSAPWQTYQVSIPGFWWQLVGGRVLRYRSISVQSLALLPATCTT